MLFRHLLLLLYAQRETVGYNRCTDLMKSWNTMIQNTCLNGMLPNSVASKLIK